MDPTSIVGNGAVKFTSNIFLSNVLCLPKFSFNLLSISLIKCAHNCGAFVVPNSCVFQDLLTKKIFGRRYEYNGLYVLDDIFLIDCYYCYPHSISITLSFRASFLSIIKEVVS